MAKTPETRQSRGQTETRGTANDDDSMTDPAPIQLDYTTRSRLHRGPVRELAHVTGAGVLWTLIALILIGTPLGWLFWAMGSAIAFPAAVTAVLLVATLGTATRAVRRRRADAVVGYLDQAVRLNQPLDKLLAAAARSETGVLRRRLENLYMATQGGTSLADAVSVAVPEVPTRTVGLIAYAESTGRLPQTLHRLLRDDLRSSPQQRDDHAFAVWYPPVLLLVVAAVLGRLSLFVLPKFLSIFRDYRTPLPRLTGWVIGAFDWGIYLAAAVALLVLVAAGGRLRQVIRGDKRTWLLQGPRDRLLWHLPVAGRMQRDRSLADLCDALADSTEQGYPLDVAVGRGQQLALNTVLLRQVSDWAGGLQAGLDPAAAATAAGLPPLVVGLIATGHGADATAGLRFAARFYRSRFTLRRELLSAAYVPVVTLVMGIVVCLVALSMFLPLRDLMDRMEPYPVGL
jgi:type II secretory pathway component PulF